jgi:hypothetical protein
MDTVLVCQIFLHDALSCVFVGGNEEEADPPADFDWDPNMD